MGPSNFIEVMLGSIALLLPCWKIAGTLLHKYFTRKMTVLSDLPKLGVSRPDQSRIKGTAVVVGGSIAGLWTARVCADHFEDVLVIEPEVWTNGDKGMEALYDENGERKDGVSTTPRQRVVQYNSSHGFQPIHLRGLRRLFPGFDKEAKKTDARILPHEYNTHAYGGHVMRIPFEAFENLRDVDGIFMSRENYERLLRRLVRESSRRIRWLTGTATGLKTAENSSVIKSVMVRAHNGHEEEIRASLVIDCSGPSQVGLRWLRHIIQSGVVSARPGSIPFEKLRLEYKTRGRYKAFRFYIPISSRTRLPIPGGYDKAGVIFYYVPRMGMRRCNFVVNRIEGHRIEISFIGCDDPPTPDSIFEIKDYWLAIHAEDPLPSWLFDILDILLQYEGPVQSSDVPFPPSSWIRYDKGPYIPSNFVALGDSVMRVNPSYGQGCSKAAIGAITLDSILRSPRFYSSTQILPDFGYEFFKKHSGRISGIWNSNKPVDYRSSFTTPIEGEKLSDGAIKARYDSTVVQLSLSDEQVNAALWKVRCFLAPPTALFHPLIMGKVASFWLKQQINF